MKISKLFIFTSLLFGLSSAAHADLFGSVKDKSVAVTYKLAVAATITTHTVVIDLSDTSNWPHKETGQINISDIRVSIDKTAASTCTIQIGVVNFVNASTGSVTWFYSQNSERNVSNTNINPFTNYHETYYRCRVNPGTTPNTNGSTPYILSSQTTTASTVYQDDLNLPSPVGTGTTKPGVGDIVMMVQNGAVALEVYVEIIYHSQPR